MLKAPTSVALARPQLSIGVHALDEGLEELLSMLLTDLGYAVRCSQGGRGEPAGVLSDFQGDTRADPLDDILITGADRALALLRAGDHGDEPLQVVALVRAGDDRAARECLLAGAAEILPLPLDDRLLTITMDKVAERILLRRQLFECTENLERLAERQAARIIELERQATVQQVMEGLSSAMAILSDDVDKEGVFNELPCYISVHSADLRILAANETFIARFGDLKGKPSRTIYKEFSGQGSCPTFQAVASRSGGRNTATLITGDGAEIPAVVHTAPITSSLDKVSLVLEVAVDVSEVTRLRSELTHARKKYEHLFNQVPCYITIQDRDLRIVEANSRFLRDFGFDRGMHCYEAYKQRDCECDNCPVRRTFDDGDPHQHEAIVTSRTGQTYNILVWTAPVFNEEGDVEHVLEVSTNITGVRKLQDQLTSLGMMLGSMSHGVKGMLGALEGGVYRVDAGLERGDMERVEKGWKVVKHRLGHMKKMVLDTLYYSKSRELNRQPLRLRDFAADAAEAVRPKAAEHDIEFAFRLSDGDHLFRADPDALLPALINFLENAVDACLFDRSKKRHLIVFRAGVQNSIVTFEITDNGVGMSEETRDNMFTLFFSSKGANGTGIGLFIANQVIERHNGSIKVDSAEGKGTSFRILLPSS